jgi:hypothetical protein
VVTQEEGGQAMSDEEKKYWITLQPFFMEKMGPWQVGDQYYSTITKVVEFITGYSGFPTSDYIRLPLPIDPRNPERGLWGMVDWDNWDISFVFDNGDVIIQKGFRLSGESIKDTPTLALLKALAAQEGETV